MNEIEYQKLLEKLDNVLKTDTTLFLKADMDVEKLSQNDTFLVHTLLHKFYAMGGIKNLSIKDIEQLHNKIITKLPTHEKFDKLDDRHD